MKAAVITGFMLQRYKLNCDPHSAGMRAWSRREVPTISRHHFSAKTAFRIDNLPLNEQATQAIPAGQEKAQVRPTSRLKSSEVGANARRLKRQSREPFSGGCGSIREKFQMRSNAAVI